MNKHDLKGIVLAGGKSLRFGDDKAMAEFDGITLIEKSVTLLQSLGLETVVIANLARDYSFLNCRIENDVIPHKGPLGGLYTACQIFPETSFLALTCDMPNLTKTALEMLIGVRRPEACPTVLFQPYQDRFQPFPGIYNAEIIKYIETLLHGEKLSMQTFLKQIPSIMQVPITSRSASLFLNINTKEDLVH